MPSVYTNTEPRPSHAAHIPETTPVRQKRETLQKDSTQFSVRKVAAAIGVQPSCLSKVEREEVAPQSEATIVRLSGVLTEEPDLLHALAGKVSADLRRTIRKRPRIFAELIRQLKAATDHAVLRLVCKVREFEK